MAHLLKSCNILCQTPLNTKIIGRGSQVIRTKAKININYLPKFNKKQSIDQALAHFDNFYAKVYQKHWQSIRLGLLSPNKYGAIINYFGDSEDIQIQLRQEGAYNIQYIYEKNLRRILRYLEKKRFFEDRRKAIQEGKEVDPEIPLVMQVSGVTSDSEFEQIGAFFTDSEGEAGGTFVNAAKMELNLNDFVPVSDLKLDEETVDDRDYYNFYDLSSDFPVDVIEQTVLNYPTNLNLYTFPRNDFSSFPSPKLDKSNLFSYYLMDCASALPVLALDIQDGDYVADFCAAPGGKSLLLYQTLKDCRFFLNDMSKSRFLRLENVFKSFVPASSRKNIEFSNRDATKLNKPNTFNKILVDVPCTNDRHSLYVNDNNIFSSKRIKERVGLPLQQLNLLNNALESVQVGGTVVYSTCSLSPIQNDGVVHMALKNTSEFSKRTFSVVNLKEAMRPLRGIFQFSHQFKFGTQVLPSVCSNFGPMYFSKLVRTN